jgi:hypothetical protein
LKSIGGAPIHNKGVFKKGKYERSKKKVDSFSIKLNCLIITLLCFLQDYVISLGKLGQSASLNI